MLNGHTCIGAVEIEKFPRKILIQRQLDGLLPLFPVWDDVRTFRTDNQQCRWYIDYLRSIAGNLRICGGFPCQDISAAGKGAGLDGERSGLWSEFARIIGEIRPREVFLENSPMLTVRGGVRVVADLAGMGYDARWGIVSASSCGAWHQRKRFWCNAVLYTDSNGLQTFKCCNRKRLSFRRADTETTSSWGSSGTDCTDNVSDSLRSRDVRRFRELQQGERPVSCRDSQRGGTKKFSRWEWWDAEPGMGRVADGIANRVDRLKSTGNAQVPIVAAVAERILR